MSKIETQLKELEKKQAALDAEKKALEAALAKKAQVDSKLEKLFKNSGFETPKALIVALMDKYNVRVTSAAAATEDKPRRKRTKVTAEFRDAVKTALKDGKSKNAVAKEFDVSYLVVNKVVDGVYDKLK